MMEIPVEKAPLVCSQRLMLALLAFFGKFFVYSARVNLSVAILCMVRSDVTPNNTRPHDLLESYNETGMTTPGLPGAHGIESEETGEFEWSKSTQSHLLSMYFYGYIFTQIPGGWLSSRFGGKRVWGICQLVSAICSLLTPISARTHIYFACAVRFILGFAAGVTFPAVHALLGRWAPPLERSKLVSYSFAGPPVGNVVTLAVSGVLCEYGFDNGWASIFYLCGIFHLLWVFAWFYVVGDSPDEHHRISDRERNYITTSIGKGIVNRKNKVPWSKIFTSKPVWAIILVHFCNNYTSYTLLTALPMYMKEALKFDIKQNGALSALPYLLQFLASFFVGYIADKVIEKHWLRVKNTRKLFQTISFLGPAATFCVLVQMTADQRYVAVALLCVCNILQSANRGAYLANYLDLAPSYAGIMFGISNTAGTIPGIIAPVIAAALTPNKTVEEWQMVFYVCVGIAVAGCLLFLLLADGELQPWSSTKGQVEKVINIDREYIQVNTDGHVTTDQIDDSE